MRKVVKKWAERGGEEEGGRQEERRGEEERRGQGEREVQVQETYIDEYEFHDDY